LEGYKDIVYESAPSSRCREISKDRCPGPIGFDFYIDKRPIVPTLSIIPTVIISSAVAKTVSPRSHAVLLVDQAGWHLSARLVVPANITIIPLPPKSPELNPVENIWQYMRDNWLSNPVFKSYDDIVDHCRYAWNTRSTMEDHVHRITTVGARVLINKTWYYPDLPCVVW
jgi:transposase